MTLRSILLGCSALALTAMPAAAQQAKLPTGFVPRINPSTGNVEMQDGQQWVPIGTIDPVGHRFVPFGQAAIGATASAAVPKGSVGSEPVTANNGAGTPTTQGVAAWVAQNAAAAAAAQATASGVKPDLLANYLPIVPQSYPGLDCTNTSDSTAAVQQMVNDATASGRPIRPVAGCVAKLTATITATGRIVAEGPGVEMTADGNTAAVDPQSIGSGFWFHLAHTGVGFKFVPKGGIAPQNFTNGNVWHGFGTYRDQPTPSTTPGTPYTPCVCDYDLAVYNGAIDYDGAVFNSTKGIFLSKGDRSRIREVKGQPLQIGVHYESAYDTPVIDDMHLWTYWSNNPNVLSYMSGNAQALKLGRADNITVKKLFAYAYGVCLDVYQYAGGGPGGTGSDGSYPGGTLYNGQFALLDCDSAGTSINVEAGTQNSNFAVASLVGYSTGLVYPGSQTNGIILNGSGNIVAIGDASLAFSGQSHVYVPGTSSKVMIGTAYLDRWNLGTTSGTPTSYAAFRAPGAGSSVTVGQNNFAPNAAGTTLPVFGTNAFQTVVPQGLIGSALNVDSTVNGTPVASGATITLPSGSVEVKVRSSADGTYCDWVGTAAVVTLAAGTSNCGVASASGKLAMTWTGSSYAIANNLSAGATTLFGSSRQLAPFN